MLTCNPDVALRLKAEHMLSTASLPNAAVFEQIIADVCERLLPDRNGGVARIRAMIAASAWTDAALSLLAAEAPQWQLYRLAYDDGEWHCALSRRRGLPEWLDDAVEAHHPDRAIALLLALVDVKASTTAAPQVSRGATHPTDASDSVLVCCENFA